MTQLYHWQVGLELGFETELLGFVCEHPARRPPAVSSMAALYAAPQFGSLRTLTMLAFCNWPREDVPGASTGTVKIRANIVGEAILRVYVA